MAEAETTTSGLDLPDVVAMTHRYYKDGRDHTSDWRLDSETWYNMVAGDQWDQNDIMKLRDQQRPAVTFNRILRTINAVCGTQVSNRQETRYIPREQGDVQVNEVLTAAGEWARDNCDAEDEESDSFRDMAICGMGWTETRLDYDDDPEGDLVIERLDPLEVYWDPAARKRNLSDARWVMHVKEISIDEFEGRWPDTDMDQAGAPWEGAEDDLTRRTHVYPQDAYKFQQSERSRGGAKQPRIRVAHVQWSEKKKGYRVGKKAERVDAEGFEKLRDKLDQRGIGYVQQADIVWKRAFIAGTALLEDVEDCPCPFGPTIRAMTYERNRNKGTWFGLVLPMVDPQRFGNKFFSQILDILNKGSKGGIMAESDAVEDFRDLEQKWARSDSVVKMRSGALSGGKIQEKPVASLPAGMDKLMGFSLDSVHEVTGINLELLGFADRNQPGIIETSRKQSGITIIAGLFDAMRRYRKEQGRVMLHMIQEHISDGRLIRIMGRDGNEQYVPLVRQPGTAKYDVIVDEAPTSPNMKEKVFGALVELLPTMGKLGVPMPPELLDYAPIPSALAGKWKELIEQASGGNPEEMQAAMEQMRQDMQKLAEENKKLSDKREETIAKLGMEQMESQAEQRLDAEKMAMQADLDRQKQEHQAALEQQKAADQVALDEWKAEQDVAIAQFKARADAEIKMAAALAKEEANGGIEGAADDLMASVSTPPRRLNMVRGADGLLQAVEIDGG